MLSASLNKTFPSFLPTTERHLAPRQREEIHCHHYMGYSFQFAQGMFYIPQPTDSITLVTLAVEHRLERETARRTTHLCEVGGLADPVDPAERDGVRATLLLRLHGVAQDVHPSPWRQDLHAGVLQTRLHSGGDT